MLKSARNTPNFSMLLMLIESLRLFFLPNAVGPPFLKYQAQPKIQIIFKMQDIRS